MNSFLDNAFGKGFTGDIDSGKVNERVPPLFMLPPMYNGYTNYTCPILEDEYDEGNDASDEYLKKLGLGYMSTKSPLNQKKYDSQPNRAKPSSAHPTKKDSAERSKIGE